VNKGLSWLYREMCTQAPSCDLAFPELVIGKSLKP
jgi:hypothetical protein